MKLTDYYMYELLYTNCNGVNMESYAGGATHCKNS